VFFGGAWQTMMLRAMLELKRVQPFSRKAGGPEWFYRTVEVENCDPFTAIGFAFGTERWCCPAAVHDIGPDAELCVLSHARVQIEKLRDEEKKRCVLIMDLTSFPDPVVAYVDGRDQREVVGKAGDDRFGRDLISAWQTYDVARQVPMVVVVNSRDDHFTGLKLLDFPK